jgi:DhnA family fructose-bisphosphate aldolase class Ia
VVALLAVLGGAPLWMGPLAQAVDGDTRLVNAAVAVSPLSHLAVAMGTDLLRTDWLYRHSSLASLHFGYPSVVSILLVYAVIGAGGLAAARLAHRSRTGAIVDRITQLQGRTNP